MQLNLAQQLWHGLTIKKMVQTPPLAAVSLSSPCSGPAATARFASAQQADGSGTVLPPETLQCGLACGVPLMLIGVWAQSHAASTGITEMNLCKVKRIHCGIVKGEEQLGHL